MQLIKYDDYDNSNCILSDKEKAADLKDYFLSIDSLESNDALLTFPTRMFNKSISEVLLSNSQAK